MYVTHCSHPAAIARVRGGEDFPGISGTVSFYPMQDGIIVAASIHGLPTKDDGCAGDIFGFHIHEGESCAGTDFSATGPHFSTGDCPHPYHTGDLPPLFASHTRAHMEVWTDRFRIQDILGRTIVIHEKADDLHSQPAGNSGRKIACGKILRNCCR